MGMMQDGAVQPSSEKLLALNKESCDYVLVCYVNKDAGYAAPIMASLDKEGYRARFECSPEGSRVWPEEYTEELVKHVIDRTARCSVCFVLASRSSALSNYCNMIACYAYLLGKHVILIDIDYGGSEYYKELLSIYEFLNTYRPWPPRPNECGIVDRVVTIESGYDSIASFISLRFSNLMEDANRCNLLKKGRSGLSRYVDTTLDSAYNLISYYSNRINDVTNLMSYSLYLTASSRVIKMAEQGLFHAAIVQVELALFWAIACVLEGMVLEANTRAFPSAALLPFILPAAVAPPSSAQESSRPDRGARWATRGLRMVKSCYQRMIQSANFRTMDTPVLSEMHFAAVSPCGIVRGEYSHIDIIMHELDWSHIVGEIRSEQDGPTKVSDGGWAKVSEGTEVTVRLSSPELGDIGSQAYAWHGRYIRFQFTFKVPESLEADQVLVNADVLFGIVPATRLSFVLPCGNTAVGDIAVMRNDINKAFMSYSSKDRPKVVRVAQGMRAVRHDLDIFMDVLKLRTGQNWQEELRKEIEASDILYLCWSRSASESKWVDFEWNYALERHGDRGVEPIAIEPPSLCPPPTKLSHKHFNDIMLYLVSED